MRRGVLVASGVGVLIGTAVVLLRPAPPRVVPLVATAPAGTVELAATVVERQGREVTLDVRACSARDVVAATVAAADITLHGRLDPGCATDLHEVRVRLP